MSDDQLDDLKQFITATVSQAVAQLNESIDLLEKKVDNGFAGVGDALEESHQQTEKRDVEVNRRLARLEQQAVR